MENKTIKIKNDRKKELEITKKIVNTIMIYK